MGALPIAAAPLSALLRRRGQEMDARPRAVAPPAEAPPSLMLFQPRPRGKDDDEALLLGTTP
jgi:hypothetical protein